jgi:enoyl-CoA hydratase
MLVELDEAFTTAEADDQVRVIILAGNGPSFSAGHDLGTPAAREEWTPGPDQHPSFGCCGGTLLGLERRMQQERHFFFRNTLRWRNLQKITIAQVHGPCYAGALILIWACDLIVAAEGTTFADVVGARLGMNGVEYFAHPWEFGARKAKELLLTGDSITAEEAYRLGMVSKVFPSGELGERTLEFARRIARVPTITAAIIKESVNQAQDNQGFYSSLQACFTLHEANHAHWAEIHDEKEAMALPQDGVPPWKDAPPVRNAEMTIP